MNTKNIIKSAILKLFDEGKTEVEAYKELSKSYSSYSISKDTVNNWYEKFRSEERGLNGNKSARSEEKLNDEDLIELIKSNPDFGIEKLAKLAGVSYSNIRKRIGQLKNDGETVYYNNKNILKFDDEFLIGLVNKNPHLNITELSRIAGTSASTIQKRIKQINSNGERAKYIKKQHIPEGFGKSKYKLTDEYIINLVNDNPKLNMYELAELGGVSQMTIHNRINKINSNTERVKYIRKNNSKFADGLLINLVDENPSFSTKELSRLVNVSQATICNRIKQINSNGEKLKYIDKRQNSCLKITDEFLIDLVNENPDLNMKELAKLAGVCEATLSNRIKKANSNGQRINYISKKPGLVSKAKITDEYLIELIKENPDLNMTELARVAKVSVSTISRRLKKIKGSKGEVDIYSKKT
jgi:DeoR/GlpR family transcriptional regulator of sugar metabolism